MILNKSSVERGLAHGMLFKTEAIDLREDKGKSQVPGTCMHAQRPALDGALQRRLSTAPSGPALSLQSSGYALLHSRRGGHMSGVRRAWECSDNHAGWGVLHAAERASCANLCVLLRAQLFAAEVKGPRDGAEERPRGAFGQELPRGVPSTPGSAAVTGPLKVQAEFCDMGEARKAAAHPPCVHRSRRSGLARVDIMAYTGRPGWHASA